MDLFQRRRCPIFQPGSDSGQETRYGRSPKGSCRYAPYPTSHCARLYQNATLRGALGRDPVDNRVRNGFNAARGPDVFTVTDPYYMFTATGTTHGSPYGYDTHVPVIFLGTARIRAGTYAGTIGVEDIAPTLATLLAIETPSGNMGRVLTEMLK